MIEIIAGTNRPGSNTLKVARLLESCYRQANASARVLSLADLPPEIFNPTSYAIKPAAFEPFTQRVVQSDGLHVVVPEYNGSFPGVMKYFIDMLKFPESFEHRCVAFTGLAAGIWGGFRSVEQLQMIFGYRNAYILPERVWIPRINNQWNSDETDFADSAISEMLQKQVDQFIQFVRRHKTGQQGTS